MDKYSTHFLSFYITYLMDSCCNKLKFSCRGRDGEDSHMLFICPPAVVFALVLTSLLKNNTFAQNSPFLCLVLQPLLSIT